MRGVWKICRHFTADGGYCTAQAGHTYLVGPRCPAHTPAAVAGRPETAPDPALTMVGLQRVAETHRLDAIARHEAPAERRRLELLGVRTFRGPSGPGGRYTSEDLDMGAVHRVEREMADLLNARSAR